jgi:hypothetical protein
MWYEMYHSFLIKYFVYFTQKHKVNIQKKKGNVHTNTIPTAITPIKQISKQPKFWKVKSSGILHQVDYWTVTNILKDLYMNCFTLQMQALRSFEVPITIYKLLWHNIPEDLKLQQHSWGNFKSHNPSFILQKSVVVLHKYASNLSKFYADGELIIQCLKEYIQITQGKPPLSLSLTHASTLTHIHHSRTHTTHTRTHHPCTHAHAHTHASLTYARTRHSRTHAHTKLFPAFKNMLIPVLKTFTWLSRNSPCCLSWCVSCRPLLPLKRS